MASRALITAQSCEPQQAAIDRYWMAQALTLAGRAFEIGEVPVGALVIHAGQVLGADHNRPISHRDPTAHAEILALRQAARQANNYRLLGATLYATLEPCAMCAGAIVQARVARVVFGAGDSRNGACGTIFNVLQNPLLNHRVALTSNVLADDAATLLRQFFRQRRGKRPDVNQIISDSEPSR